MIRNVYLRITWSIPLSPSGIYSEEVPWAEDVGQWVKALAAHACGPECEPELRHPRTYMNADCCWAHCDPVLGKEGGARRFNWNFLIREPSQKTVSSMLSDRLPLCSRGEG